MKQWQDTINWLNEMLPSEAGRFVIQVDELTGELTGCLDVVEQPGWVVSLELLQNCLGTLDLDKLAKMDEDAVARWIANAYACTAESIVYPLLAFQEFEAASNERKTLRYMQPDIPELTLAEWALDRAVDYVASLLPELFSLAKKDELAAQLIKTMNAIFHNCHRGQALQREGWYLYQPVEGEPGYDYPELHWNPIWNSSGPWQAFKES